VKRLLTLIALLALACGMKEPDAERVRKSVASWDASLALTAGSWIAHHVPGHFVRNAVEAAVDEVSKDVAAKVPPEVVTASAHTLALAHQLQEAVEHEDRGAALRVQRELEQRAKELQ
jgi:hypothetical protein